MRSPASYVLSITLLTSVSIAILSSSCVSPQKISLNKSRILDPMMDPAKTGGFHSAFRGEPLKASEHGSLGGNGSVGGSCPTCGG